MNNGINHIVLMIIKIRISSEPLGMNVKITNRLRMFLEDYKPNPSQKKTMKRFYKQMMT
jgi:hypothetical protein